MKGNNNKCDKGNKSVAESLNAIVKPHLAIMSEQYNVYAKAILEMEEKITALKQIMLSQDFLNNIRDINIVTCHSNAGMDKKKEMKKETKTENIVLSNIEVETSSTDSTELSFFTPQQKDSLFWCFYIIVNDLAKYEYECEKNYFTAEQEFKVKTIEQIKSGHNKQILKEHKMSKNMIESGLMGVGAGVGISPKILYALSLFYNVNIFYVYKNTYYEMFSNANKDDYTNAKIHVIKFNPETNYYSVSIDTDTDTDKSKKEYIENIKKTSLELDNLDDVNKPLRPIASYSLSDLINIAARMNIQNTHIQKEHDDTNSKVKVKSKTKSELYTEIMEKCL